VDVLHFHGQQTTESLGAKSAESVCFVSLKIPCDVNTFNKKNPATELQLTLHFFHVDVERIGAAPFPGKRP